MSAYGSTFIYLRTLFYRDPGRFITPAGTCPAPAACQEALCLQDPVSLRSALSAVTCSLRGLCSALGCPRVTGLWSSALTSCPLDTETGSQRCPRSRLGSAHLPACPGWGVRCRQEDCLSIRISQRHNTSGCTPRSSEMLIVADNGWQIHIKKLPKVSK